MDYTKMTDRVGGTAATYDQGLRSYMLSVYNYMSMALALTGIVALLTASSPEIMGLFYTQTARGVGLSGLGWLITFAPLLFVIGLNAGINRMSASTAQLVFWVYAAVMGLSLSSVFMIYTGVFFITASVFGMMSIYGYTTKKDLTSMGSFLIMGLSGIIIAIVVNFFLHSSGLQFAISTLGVLIFVGLTAYDTQAIKAMYYAYGNNSESSSKSAIMGALKLNLDFINIFLNLLQFFGDRR